MAQAKGRILLERRDVLLAVRGRERFHYGVNPSLGVLMAVVGSGQRVRMGGEERDAKGGHRRRDALELRRIELVEDAPDDLRPGRFDVFEHLPADRRDPHEDDPAILRDPDPFHEAALLDPIDEPGRG